MAILGRQVVIKLPIHKEGLTSENAGGVGLVDIPDSTKKGRHLLV
jgi:hypothetical protein